MMDGGMDLTGNGKDDRPSRDHRMSIENAGQMRMHTKALEASTTYRKGKIWTEDGALHWILAESMYNMYDTRDRPEPDRRCMKKLLQTYQEITGHRSMWQLIGPIDYLRLHTLAVLYYSFEGAVSELETWFPSGQQRESTPQSTEITVCISKAVHYSVYPLARVCPSSGCVLPNLRLRRGIPHPQTTSSHS